jgi:hypothetical protein
MKFTEKKHLGDMSAKVVLIKCWTKNIIFYNDALPRLEDQVLVFFALANTVATGDQKKRFTHGWMGVRFQSKPKGEANDIIIHVRLLDKYRLQQQETLGVLGVNLVYTAFTWMKNPLGILDSLVENIKEGQVAIDLIKCTGPEFKEVNNHLLNLELVRKGLADAILFGPNNDILTVGDELFQKPVIVQRGIYNPVTNTHIDVIEKGLKQFKKDFPEEKKTSGPI